MEIGSVVRVLQLINEELMVMLETGSTFSI